MIENQPAVLSTTDFAHPPVDRLGESREEAAQHAAAAADVAAGNPHGGAGS
jgi:hypothetical protein